MSRSNTSHHRPLASITFPASSKHVNNLGTRNLENCYRGIKFLKGIGGHRIINHNIHAPSIGYELHPARYPSYCLERLLHRFFRHTQRFPSSNHREGIFDIEKTGKVRFKACTNRRKRSSFEIEIDIFGENIGRCILGTIGHRIWSTLEKTFRLNHIEVDDPHRSPLKEFFFGDAILLERMMIVEMFTSDIGHHRHLKRNPPHPVLIECMR